LLGAFIISFAGTMDVAGRYTAIGGGIDGTGMMP
jgi:hypothetical protein